MSIDMSTRMAIPVGCAANDPLFTQESPERTVLPIRWPRDKEMHLLEVILVGTTGFWGQLPPTSSPPTAEGTVPYTRLVDSILPADWPNCLSDSPVQLEKNPSRQVRAEAWGLVGAKAYYAGNRVAPNGFSFDPLFSLGN